MSTTVEAYTAAIAALNLPAGLSWSVRVSAKSRQGGATVLPGGAVVFVAPATATPADVAASVRRMLGKVLVSVRESETKGVRIVSKDLVNGEGFPLLGRPYRLRLVEDGDHETSPRRPIALTAHPGVPIVGEPGPSTWSGHRTWQLTMRRDAAAARTVIEWYREQGQAWLDRTVPAIADRLGVRAGLTWRVRPYRAGTGYGGSWASYHTDKHDIGANWIMFQFPRDLAEHIVYHEVAHAAVPRAGHGRAWQQVMHGIRQDWRDVDRAARTADGLVLWDGTVNPTPAPVPAAAGLVSAWGA